MRRPASPGRPAAITRRRSTGTATEATAATATTSATEASTATGSARARATSRSSCRRTPLAGSPRCGSGRGGRTTPRRGRDRPTGLRPRRTRRRRDRAARRTCRRPGGGSRGFGRGGSLGGDFHRWCGRSDGRGRLRGTRRRGRLSRRSRWRRWGCSSRLGRGRRGRSSRAHRHGRARRSSRGWWNSRCLRGEGWSSGWGDLGRRAAPHKGRSACAWSGRGRNQTTGVGADRRLGGPAGDPPPGCRRRLRLRLGLFWRHVSAKALGVGLPADAVCLRVLDRGRVTLDPYSEGYAEVQRLFVCEPELPRELVNPDLLGHLLLGSFFRLDHLLEHPPTHALRLISPLRLMLPARVVSTPFQDDDQLLTSRRVKLCTKSPSERSFAQGHFCAALRPYAQPRPASWQVAA